MSHDSSHSSPDSSFDDRFRRVATDDGWSILIAVTDWPNVHTPVTRWVTFRHWKRQPTEQRINSARRAALADRRFFRHCKRCGQLHDRDSIYLQGICSECLEKEGIVIIH